MHRQTFASIADLEQVGITLDNPEPRRVDIDELRTEINYTERREITLAVATLAHELGCHPDAVRAEPALLAAAIRRRASELAQDDRRPLPGWTFEDWVDAALNCE